jgi:hypothetical protein
VCKGDDVGGFNPHERILDRPLRRFLEKKIPVEAGFAKVF